MSRHDVVLGQGLILPINFDKNSYRHRGPSTPDGALSGRLTLVCSTSHIRRSDDRALWSGADAQHIIVHAMDPGWLIRIYFDEESQEERGKQPDDTPLSEEFWALLTWAYDRGFDWVLLDPDGPIVQDLITFEWSE